MNLAALPLVVQILCFIGSFVALSKGADLLVEGASALARRLKVSDLVIGLTVIAFGTSAPEFAVSGIASYQGSDSISLGNVVGSNIFNLGFILAICALSATLTVSKELFYRDGMILLTSVVLLASFSYTESTISRLEGITLMACLISYVILLIVSERRKASPSTTSERQDELPRVLTCTFKIILGLILLLGGSQVLVELATFAAQKLGISEWIIGITIVATGTSLPELVTALTSLKKGKQDIGVGNLIGSDIFNILGVLGLSSFIKPIQVSAESQNAVFILVASILVLLAMMRSSWQLGRNKGIILMLISMLRWGLNIL